MADHRLTKLVDKLEKAKAHAANLRKKGEEAAGRLVHGGLTIGGGATVGAVRGLAGRKEDNYRVFIPGSRVQADLVGGGALVVLGVTDMAGKYSDHAVSFGSGMLAVVAAEHTLDAIVKHDAKR